MDGGGAQAAVVCRGVAKSGSVSPEEEGEMRFVVVQKSRPRRWRKRVRWRCHGDLGIAGVISRVRLISGHKRQDLPVCYFRNHVA